MTKRYIYNTSGQYVGFTSNGYLYTKAGQYLGFIRATNEFFSKDGQFIGYLLDDDRVVKKTSDFTRMPIVPPIEPVPPIPPIAPLNRFPYSPLPPGYEDVFDMEQAGLGLSKREDFSRFEGMDLVADDNTFLGKISKDRYDPKSISHRYSYGSRYQDNSIFNIYGKYGGKYSNQSPFNRYASRPPHIRNRGKTIAVLSANQNVCGNLERVDPKGLLLWLGHLAPA